MSHGTHGFATVPVKFPDRKFMLVVSITVQLLAEFERCWINKQYSQFYRKLEEFWISCKRVCGWHIRKSDSSDQTGVSFSQPPVFYHFQWAIFPGSSYAETISFKSRLSVPNFVRQNPERKVWVWGYNSIPQSVKSLQWSPPDFLPPSVPCLLEPSCPPPPSLAAPSAAPSGSGSYCN